MASKGVFDVLEAVRRLGQAQSVVHFVCAGRPLGDEEMSVIDASARLASHRADPGIEFVGSVPPERMALLLDYADVVALPSRYSSECQPLSIIQAMCAGAALVVADTPALRATVGDYPAEWVPIRSIEAIGDALGRLASEKAADPALFRTARSLSAQAARARFAVARFDAEMRTILDL